MDGCQEARQTGNRNVENYVALWEIVSQFMDWHHVFIWICWQPGHVTLDYDFLDFYLMCVISALFLYFLGILNDWTCVVMISIDSVMIWKISNCIISSLLGCATETLQMSRPPVSLSILCWTNDVTRPALVANFCVFVRLVCPMRVPDVLCRRQRKTQPWKCGVWMLWISFTMSSLCGSLCMQRFIRLDKITRPWKFGEYTLNILRLFVTLRLVCPISVPAALRRLQKNTSLVF